MEDPPRSFPLRRFGGAQEGCEPCTATTPAAPTRGQCLAASLTSRQLDHLLGIHALEPVFAGVYRDPSRPFDIDGRAMAATLAGGRDAVASHRMAVAVWGMRSYRCDLTEITAPQHVARAGLIAHRCRGAIEWVSLRGIPVTTPARTLLDSASVVGPAPLGFFAETWLSSGSC